MPEKPWISGIPSDEKESYKPITKCNYWLVLGSFNNWNIIQLSQKSTPSDIFDDIHRVVLDGISDNTASLDESENMEPLTQLIQKLMDFMLSCSHHNHIHYSLTYGCTSSALS